MHFHSAIAKCLTGYSLHVDLSTAHPNSGDNPSASNGKSSFLILLFTNMETVDRCKADHKWNGGRVQVVYPKVSLGGTYWLQILFIAGTLVEMCIQRINVLLQYINAFYDTSAQFTQDFRCILLSGCFCASGIGKGADGYMYNRPHRAYDISISFRICNVLSVQCIRQQR